jgi:hypothetical protein
VAPVAAPPAETAPVADVAKTKPAPVAKSETAKPSTKSGSSFVAGKAGDKSVTSVSEASPSPSPPAPAAEAVASNDTKAAAESQDEAAAPAAAGDVAPDRNVADAREVDPSASTLNN